MNTTIDQLTAAQTFQIMRRLAHDFQIPEMADADLNNTSDSPFTWVAEDEFQPTGQGATTWQFASFTVASAAMTKDQQGDRFLVAAVRVTIRYQHHGGGGNAVDRYLRVLLSRNADAPRVAAVLDDTVFNDVWCAGYDNGKAAQ